MSLKTYDSLIGTSLNYVSIKVEQTGTSIPENFSSLSLTHNLSRQKYSNNNKNRESKRERKHGWILGEGEARGENTCEDFLEEVYTLS